MKFINTLIVGSGAAGMNAAVSLYKKGITDIAIITEGIFMGTSHNTGSDKQTYFKQMTSGLEQDSVQSMAEDLFAGGAMDGDLALCEASLSLKSFYHLLDIGVPFPDNEYGEYYGYKTDHDTKTRGISAGPLTSKYMTECLKKEIDQLGIEILERYQIVKIITLENAVAGCIAIDLRKRKEGVDALVSFACENIIWATGGEASMYGQSVYPVSQHGSTGTALEAGILGKNVTESQYGIASTKFRWNLSGTFQQVMPRYISCDKDGNNEREFLEDYYKNPGKLSSSIFLKGYQWPFNASKIENQASSYIDLLVFNEIFNKGRRVFMDFRQNPTILEKNGEMDFSLIERSAYDYLKQSEALLAKPIDRLQKMNPAAIELYKSNHIDLRTEPLEIAICAQHNNGGLSGDVNWESSLNHFFPIGEVNGSHGVYRPGGSALNSGQCGAERAAGHIATYYFESTDRKRKEEILEHSKEELKQALRNRMAAPGQSDIDLNKEREALHKRMDKSGGPIRVREEVKRAIDESRLQLMTLDTCRLEPVDLAKYFILRDAVICSYVYLSAINDYISKGGASRGSYLVLEKKEQLDEIIATAKNVDETKKKSFMDQIQEVQLEYPSLQVKYNWRPVRPIPERESWFENIWNAWILRNNPSQ